MGEQFLLNLVELVLGQARRRKDRLPAGIAVLPDHHIAAAEVGEVVGEGAHGAQDWIGVPARLVFDALTLDRALAQQVV